MDFFNKISEVEKNAGVIVGHETHRSRILYSPWVTRDLLPLIPANINITADLSHWVTVAERPPTDENLVEVVKMIAPRVRHIHSRVGHERTTILYTTM